MPKSISPDNVSHAQIQLDERGFNEMPGRDEVVEELSKHIPDCSIADTDERYWKNDRATLVIRIQDTHVGPVAIAKFAQAVKADEIDGMQMRRNGVSAFETIVRFWWD